MAHLNRKAIQARAYELLEASPGGLRWSELLKQVHQGDPETPQNSIQGALHALLSGTGSGISKVARGTYQLSKYSDQAGELIVFPSATPSASVVSVPPEAEFYESFAGWLVDTAEEANEAQAIGGNMLKGKWGTPDVIGVLKARADDILKFPTQIVSAEIKTNTQETVTAFGQCIAYRLFSHKSYIVVPNTITQDDLARLKALCSLHGVGLVTFTADPKVPDYTIIVPAQYAEPDMFYANQMARRLRETYPKTFHRFFS
jgi:hypothetical protein